MLLLENASVRLNAIGILCNAFSSSMATSRVVYFVGIPNLSRFALCEMPTRGRPLSPHGYARRVFRAWQQHAPGFKPRYQEASYRIGKRAVRHIFRLCLSWGVNMAHPTGAELEQRGVHSFGESCQLFQSTAGNVRAAIFAAAQKGAVLFQHDSRRNCIREKFCMRSLFIQRTFSESKQLSAAGYQPLDTH